MWLPGWPRRPPSPQKAERVRMIAVNGYVTGWRWWVDAQVAFHKVCMYVCMYATPRCVHVETCAQAFRGNCSAATRFSQASDSVFSRRYACYTLGRLLRALRSVLGLARGCTAEELRTDRIGAFFSLKQMQGRDGQARSCTQSAAPRWGHCVLMDR
jgi:hypothetical protein